MTDKIVNLDEINSIKDALVAYQTINNNKYSHIIQGNVTIPLEDITAYSSSPSLGFKEGILPSYLTNIRVDGTRHNIEILLSERLTKSELNEKQELWNQQKGYSTKKSIVSFKIINQNDQTIAIYRRDKISIDRDYLDEFIENLQE